MTTRNNVPRGDQEGGLGTTLKRWLNAYVVNVFATVIDATTYKQGGITKGFITDHHELAGLSDDDHSQYHNDSRGDARYPPLSKGVTNGDSHDHAGGDGAQVDHGGLAGLADDDHSQYLNTTRHDTTTRHTLGTVVSHDDHGALSGLGDDDHTQYIRHILATAANDFLVASGSGVFVKKTLAETLTILGDASTTTHGLLLAATAPAAGLLNVPGIANGETVYTMKPMFDSTNPANLGTAGPGSQIISARRDHVHAMPALDTLESPTDIITLNASTTLHGLLLKAVAPASGLLNVVGIGNGETIYSMKAMFDTTNPAREGTAAPGTLLIAARRDHVHPTVIALARLDAAVTTTSTTAANITGLSVSVAANETIQFEAYLNNGNTGTTGNKFAVNFPSGGTLMCHFEGSTSGVTAMTQSKVTAAATLTTEIYHTLATQVGRATLMGTFKNGSTAGTLQIQFAAVTSGTVTINAGSYLKVIRMSSATAF
jgi:hypothetical protein